MTNREPTPRTCYHFKCSQTPTRIHYPKLPDFNPLWCCNDHDPIARTARWVRINPLPQRTANAIEPEESAPAVEAIGGRVS